VLKIKKSLYLSPIKKWSEMYHHKLIWTNWVIFKLCHCHLLTVLTSTFLAWSLKHWQKMSHECMNKMATRSTCSLKNHKHSHSHFLCTAKKPPGDPVCPPLPTNPTINKTLGHLLKAKHNTANWKKPSSLSPSFLYSSSCSLSHHPSYFCFPWKNAANHYGFVFCLKSPPFSPPTHL
jgi:hypothetical protein